jgi:hypothetical protein
MSHPEAPSCNGSQQESQKLTGDAAGETPTPRTDAFSNVIAAQGTAKPAWYEFARGLERESSSLKAQLEGFRKRYLWLADKVIAPDYGDNPWRSGGKGKGYWIKHCKGPGWIEGETLDAAIDSALHHEEGI